MTLSEYTKMLENSFKDKTSTDFSTFYENDFTTNFLNAWSNTLNRSLSSSDIAHIDFASYFTNKFASKYSKIDYDMVTKVFDAFPRAQTPPSSDFYIGLAFPSQAILDQLCETLSRVEPYLPPEEQEKCETEIRPKLEKKPGTKLSLTDVATILGTLIGFFALLVTLLPDKQLDRIISQNETIIEQHAEIAQLSGNEKNLLETLDTLSDSINLLANEVELLREELESSDDSPDNTGLEATDNPQQQDDNAQE